MQSPTTGDASDIQKRLARLASCRAVKGKKRIRRRIRRRSETGCPHPDVLSDLGRLRETPHLLLFSVEEIEVVSREPVRIERDEFREFELKDRERLWRSYVLVSFGQLN